jgi:hypothetical protein
MRVTTLTTPASDAAVVARHRNDRVRLATPVDQQASLDG